MPLNAPNATPSAAVLERFQAVRGAPQPQTRVGWSRRAHEQSAFLCTSAASPQELERNNDEVLYRLAQLAASTKDADAIYRGIIKVLLARNRALPFVLRMVDDDLQATGTGGVRACRRDAGMTRTLTHQGRATLVRPVAFRPRSAGGDDPGRIERGGPDHQRVHVLARAAVPEARARRRRAGRLCLGPGLRGTVARPLR